jgi:hypothetical protein
LIKYAKEQSKIQEIIRVKTPLTVLRNIPLNSLFSKFGGDSRLTLLGSKENKFGRKFQFPT